MTPTEETPTLAAQIEALAPCPNPWCTSRSAPIPIRSRMASNGWHAACACGIRSWSRPSEAEAVETWNTRPAIVTALRQAEAAPGVVEALERLVAATDQRALRGRDHVPSMREEQQARWVAREALARQHGAREGKIGMEYDPSEEEEREEKKRIAADVRRRFPAAPATDVGEAK